MRHLENLSVETRMGYAKRVNLAIDHVLAHLSEPLRLADAARAAGFSPFHFHRVFQALTGETLAEFVRRARLERALGLMAYTQGLSLTMIALRCGFPSSSDFSRAFRKRYGSAPSKFDLKGWRERHGAELEAIVYGTASRYHVERLPADRNPDQFKVAIRHLPARAMAYIRVERPYEGDSASQAYRRLLAWAEHRGLADRQWYGFQWDNPEITPLEQCRYHVAVEADQFSPEGEIGRYEFPPMTVAQVEIRGGLELELRALYWLYGTWLPRSGYVPDDQPAFEAWRGRPFVHGTEYFELHAHLPIRRG